MYGKFAQKNAAFAREKCRAKKRQKRRNCAIRSCCCESLCVATCGAPTSPKVWSVVLSVVNLFVKSWLFLEVCARCYSSPITSQKNYFFIWKNKKKICINSSIMFWPINLIISIVPNPYGNHTFPYTRHVKGWSTITCIVNPRILGVYFWAVHNNYWVMV